jgi:hypothetical protein
VQYVGRTIIGIGQGLFQKVLGRFAVPRFGKVEIHGLTMLIDDKKQVHPLAGNPNEGFI